MIRLMRHYTTRMHHQRKPLRDGDRSTSREIASWCVTVAMSEPPHVYTLTGNLLAERTFEFEAWQPGKTQRAKRESFQVGGKGINVSKMLNRLGVPNTALCFAGGAAGPECEAWLGQRGFRFRSFASTSPTRPGLVVRGVGQPETTFLGADSIPSPDAIAACAGYLAQQPDGQVLALCGSFPGWDDSSFDVLRATCERWLKRGKLVADVYGSPLAWAAQRALELVKINATEFRALSGAHVQPPVGLREQALASPVRRWVVSDGRDQVWFKDEGMEPASLMPPLVEEVSATGSGDVMFASILQSLFVRNATLRDAVAGALPLAAANAAHPGVAEFP
jgi:1-phosphofructokinase